MLCCVSQISGNHRVNENPEEQQRVKSLGGSIAQSDVDGVIAGPLRVWPGGLAMTRSLGDAEAGALVFGKLRMQRIVSCPHRRYSTSVATPLEAIATCTCCV